MYLVIVRDLFIFVTKLVLCHRNDLNFINFLKHKNSTSRLEKCILRILKYKVLNKNLISFREVG